MSNEGKKPRIIEEIEKELGNEPIRYLPSFPLPDRALHIWTKSEESLPPFDQRVVLLIEHGAIIGWLSRSGKFTTALDGRVLDLLETPAFWGRLPGGYELPEHVRPPE